MEDFLVGTSRSRSYPWYARLMPMYLALLPVGLGLTAWLTELTFSKALALGGIAPASLAVFLMEVARDRGRRKQQALWDSWGGPLLTQYLRHRNSEINAYLKAEYHRKIQELMPNLRIPSAQEERNDPEAADDVYGASAQHLVNVVREDPERFWTAFNENRSYGFRRNLWGLKPLGVSGAVIGLMATLGKLTLAWRVGTETPLLGFLGGLVSLGLLTAWVLVVTPEWVRLANDAYARRVLECIPRMDSRDVLS